MIKINVLFFYNKKKQTNINLCFAFMANIYFSEAISMAQCDMHFFSYYEQFYKIEVSGLSEIKNYSSKKI